MMCLQPFPLHPKTITNAHMDSSGKESIEGFSVSRCSTIVFCTDLSAASAVASLGTSAIVL